jgi:hemoglobin
MTAVTLRICALVLAVAAGCCDARAADTLYLRLGGDEGVTAIADTLIDRVVGDPLLGPSFRGSNLNRIKRLLAEQICDLSGGPCHYSGDSMKEVHAGHHITQAQFYRMVEVLKAVLKDRGTSVGATNELLRLLAPTKRDVVEPPEGKGGPTRLQSTVSESSNAGPAQ